MVIKKEQIKIAVVDDHNLFRKGLIKLINLADQQNKYVILFEAEDGDDLKRKIDKQSLPDIILMDIDMPHLNGYETVDWLRKYYPDISVLIVSMFETEEAVLRMLRMGVKGYLSKDIDVEDMNLALDTIINKGYYYSDFVSETMAQSIQKNTVDGSNKQRDVNDLSATEREFLKLACTELTYHQIAERMNLSPKTIDDYRERLFHRFKVKSRVSLAMFAVKQGIVKI
jgi:two-component system, NarL family, invasion response regulator UvrY